MCCNHIHQRKRSQGIQIRNTAGPCRRSLSGAITGYGTAGPGLCSDTRETGSHLAGQGGTFSDGEPLLSSFEEPYRTACPARRRRNRWSNYPGGDQRFVFAVIAIRRHQTATAKGAAAWRCGAIRVLPARSLLWPRIGDPSSFLISRAGRRSGASPAGAARIMATSILCRSSSGSGCEAGTRPGR